MVCLCIAVAHMSAATGNGPCDFGRCRGLVIATLGPDGHGRVDAGGNRLQKRGPCVLINTQMASAHGLLAGGADFQKHGGK